MAPTRWIALGALGLLAAGCGLLDAVTGFFESSDDAAVAAKKAAEQAEETMHQIEHFLLFIPVYLAGEFRPMSKMGRGAMGMWKKRKDGKKKAA